MKDTVLQNRIYRHKQTARNILGNTEAVVETTAAMEGCGSRGELPNKGRRKAGSARNLPGCESARSPRGCENVGVDVT